MCDLDAFFASVEQRDRPELRGRPVIIGGSPEGRGVASTCSYEARVYGVRSAMPMKKALALCPDAVVLRGRMSRYKEVSAQVHHIFTRFTPEIEPVSIDEAYLSVTGGTGMDIGRAIHRTVREELDLPISVGISLNKLLAKIACEQAKPAGVRALWPEEVPERLWPLPVRTLPGIGPATEKALRRCNIHTVKDLAAYPPDALVRILGKNAHTVHGYAHGMDKRALALEHEAKSISEETTFPEDIRGKEIIDTVLLDLSSGVGYRLRRAGFAARTITLKLRFADFRTITRGKSLPEPVYSDKAIYDIARTLFHHHCGAGPWRLVGVQASGFETGSQLTILPPTPAEEKEKLILKVRDGLRDKYGTEVVFQAKRLRGNNREE